MAVNHSASHQALAQSAGDGLPTSKRGGRKSKRGGRKGGRY